MDAKKLINDLRAVQVWQDSTVCLLQSIRDGSILDYHGARLAALGLMRDLHELAEDWIVELEG